MKGPLLNNNNRDFTTRNSLGIEDVASSISGELCPVVNTVTPRAFYWPFMVWIYHDFYLNTKVEERCEDSFKKYLRRQDYFFILSQLVVDAPDKDNLVGKDNVRAIWDANPTGPFLYNDKYFKASYGGMQYYNAGCLSLRYIEDAGKKSVAKVTQYGKEIAQAFAEVIKDTTYYKEYRQYDVPVPIEVLKEYGTVINIGLKGFEVSKAMLRDHLFVRRLKDTPTDSSKYLQFIFTHKNMDGADLAKFRNVLFDVYSSRGDNESIDEDIAYMSRGWEVVVGRQYFTCGIESIWKYMLYILRANRLTKKQWIEKSIVCSEWSIDLNTPLVELVKECDFDFKTREEMISHARSRNNHKGMVEDGLRIVLSMYNRFNKRDDISEKAWLSKGCETHSISFAEVIKKVDEYKDRNVKEFLEYVMGTWLIDQHYYTAKEKMMRSTPLDGFYYDYTDGYYSHRYDFGIDFQGIRLLQLSQVMKDLDMI